MRAGNQRRLRVTAQPNVTLTLADAPPRCRRARTVLLGPLTPTDLDAASFINAPQGALHSRLLWVHEPLVHALVGIPPRTQTADIHAPLPPAVNGVFHAWPE